MTLPYPPPFQDLKTVAEHCSLSERKIEDLLKAGRFPKPRKEKCGKRLWVWTEVEEWLSAPENDGFQQGGPIYEATRRLAGGTR